MYKKLLLTAMVAISLTACSNSNNQPAPTTGTETAQTTAPATSDVPATAPAQDVAPSQPAAPVDQPTALAPTADQPTAPMAPAPAADQSTNNAQADVTPSTVPSDSTTTP